MVLSNTQKNVQSWYAARCWQPVYTRGEITPAQKKAFEGLHGRVLDLCCGGGRHSFFLASLGLDVVGLDFTPQMIQEARAQGREPAFLVGDACHLPFEDCSFDHVVCMGSLQCIPTEAQRLALLREVARVLKPGGELFAITSSLLYPGFLGLRWLALAAMALRYGQLGDVRSHSDSRSPFLHHSRKEELKRMLKAAGLACQVLTEDEYLGQGGLLSWASIDLVILATKP